MYVVSMHEWALGLVAVAVLIFCICTVPCRALSITFFFIVMHDRNANRENLHKQRYWGGISSLSFFSEIFVSSLQHHSPRHRVHRTFFLFTGTRLSVSDEHEKNIIYGIRIEDESFVQLWLCPRWCWWWC